MRHFRLISQFKMGDPSVRNEETTKNYVRNVSPYKLDISYKGSGGPVKWDWNERKSRLERGIARF